MIIMMVITILVAAILGKLLTNLAIGKPSQTLNSEFERISERLSDSERRIRDAETLIEQRGSLLKMLKARHGIS